MIIFLSFCFQLTAQNEQDCRDFLNQINSIEDLQALKPAFPDWRISNVVITPFELSQDSMVLTSSPVLTLDFDGSKNYMLKVINKESKEFCKLKYILINNPSLDSNGINQLQEEIIHEYNSGKTAQELIDKYHQLGNPTGDLDWFNKDLISPEFEREVWDLEVNAAVKVNIPNKEWFYVVFKTHSNIVTDVANCVKIKVCNVGCKEADMEMPEILAEFPGGSEAMKQFILNEVQYPKVALDNKTEGRVTVSFIVERNGTISNIKIVKGVSLELNNEAKRLVEAMPLWIPAMHGGSKVRSQCQLPITFHL